jgi:hypothetical protein
MTALAAGRDVSLEARATGRSAVRLKPVEYVQLYGPPERRCSGCHHRKPSEHLAGGRLDRLVLQELADVAAWGRDGRSWGDEARPSVPGIARRLGYSERSVQYALRRLESPHNPRGPYVERVERVGFTAWYRICRPVEPVDEFADVVEIGSRRRVVKRRRNTGTPPFLHPPGATVAPELGTEQENPAPVVPAGQRSVDDRAAARTQAAPQRRGVPSPAPSEGGPPSLVGSGGRAHRGDAGPGRVLGVADMPPDGLADTVLAGVAALAPPGRGDSTSYRLSRAKARRRRCPRCAAPPGEACRGCGGRLRKSVHAERREPSAPPMTDWWPRPLDDDNPF